MNKKLLTFLKEEGIFFNEKNLKILLKTKTTDKISIKFGIDTNNFNFHIGHLYVFSFLKELQKRFNIKIKIVFGTFTTLFGDPSLRLITRKKIITLKIALKNAENYKKILINIFEKHKITFFYNHLWLKKINLYNFFLFFLKKINLKQFLARKETKKRLLNKENIKLSEFLYPVLQALDSIEINNDIEIGGEDQRFNLKYARKFSNFKTPKKQINFFIPLLLDKNKKKIGKSNKNILPITNNFFNNIMSLLKMHDENIDNYKKIFTKNQKIIEELLPEEEKLIKQIKIPIIQKKITLVVQILKSLFNKKISIKLELLKILKILKSEHKILHFKRNKNFNLLENLEQLFKFTLKRKNTSRKQLKNMLKKNLIIINKTLNCNYHSFLKTGDKILINKKTTIIIE